MSAWIVDRIHIDLLVRLAFERDHYGMFPTSPVNEHGEALNASEIGRMLWLENLASVAYRYPGDGDGARPGQLESDAEIAGYTYTDPDYLPTPGEACKLIHCFDYQSCEHPGWEQSQARKFCRELEAAQTRRIADYKDAPWGWSADDLAEAKRRALAARRAWVEAERAATEPVRHRMVYDGGGDKRGHYACEATGLFTRDAARVTCPDCLRVR